MLSVPVRPSPATMTRIPSTLGANKSMKSKWCLNAMAVTPEQLRVWSKLKGATLSLKSGHPHNTWRIDSFLPGLEPPNKLQQQMAASSQRFWSPWNSGILLVHFAKGVTHQVASLGSPDLRLKTSDLRISPPTSLAISMPNSTPDQGSNS